MNMTIMKKYYWIALLGVLVMSLQACVSDADVDVPEVAPKLVVQGFISPQEDQVQIKVSKSKPVFGLDNEGSLYIENAAVKLMSISDTVILEYNSIERFYYINQDEFPITGGQTYWIEVSADDLPTVYSSTTVPTITPFVNSATYLSTQNFEGGGFGESSTTFEYNVQWMDMESGESYYRLILGLEGIGSGSEPVDLYYTDALNDGEIISKNVFVGTWYDDINPEQEPFGIYLLSLDENYYLYHRNLILLGGGDPFSEPVQLHSNIINGLGCFGSFNGSYQQF
jgi:hypothetical protein